MAKKLVVIFKAEFGEFYRNNKAIIWLSLLFALLKIPSLFEPYWYGDEGITMAVGMAIKKGLLLYRDIYDNKPPLLYLIASIINGRLFFLKLFSLFLGMVGFWIFFRLSEFVLSTKKNTAVLVSSLLFVGLTTTPFFEGNIVNGEIVFLVFSITGWYFALVRKKYLTSGLFFALAFLTKAPALFDMIPLMVWLLIQIVDRKSSFSLKHLILLIVAFVLPIVSSFVYFLVRGGINEYIQSAFLQMVGYVSSWGPSGDNSRVSLLENPLAVKAIFLILVILFFTIRWFRKWQISLTEPLVLWLICSLFGATMSGRPYPHYLLQTVAPFCLCIGSLLAVKKREFCLVILSLSLFGFAYFKYHFWRYPTWNYYRNFTNLMIRGQDEKEFYYQFFDTTLPEVYQVANLISAYTGQDDRIFVWSDYAQLYPLSRRLPAYRATAAYHVSNKMVKSDDFFTAVISPTVIIIDKRIGSNAALISLIAKDYRLAETSTNFDLYALKAGLGSNTDTNGSLASDGL